ncbi:MAG: ComF family protein [Candidatus Daviesbacteria bacterium]|nr:ComF family protein [Candidatus Daviesbacteria bacterium]
MNFFDLFFPKKCCGCGKFGSYFCDSCIKNILQQDLVCPNCEKNSIGGKSHPLCQKRYGLDGLWSLGIYQAPLKKAIQKLKYKFVSDIAESLIDLMIEYWAKYTPQFIDEIKKDRGEGWIIVPVPLYVKRQKWRGFNQSALLGKILASKIGLEYTEALKRTKHTKPQVGLQGWERKKNIKNAFSFNSKFLNPNSNILLIDDVWTTGSTLKECCYILKRNGAKSVWAITLAR